MGVYGNVGLPGNSTYCQMLQGSSKSSDSSLLGTPCHLITNERLGGGLDPLELSEHISGGGSRPPKRLNPNIMIYLDPTKRLNSTCFRGRNLLVICWLSGLEVCLASEDPGSNPQSCQTSKCFDFHSIS